MQIYLIRHPRPLIEPGICYGRLDVAIAEDLAPVVARLRAVLPAGIPVFSSPLRRARELAEALHPAPCFDTRLQEIDFGDWEGRPWDKIERAALDAWAADVLNFTPPGGESPRQLRARALEFVADLGNQSAALVTHAGVIRSLLGHWHGLTLAEWTTIKLEFGSLTPVELYGFPVRLPAH